VRRGGPAHRQISKRQNSISGSNLTLAAAVLVRAAWRCRLQSSALHPWSWIRRNAPAWLRVEVHIRHCEAVGVADDVGDAAIFLDGRGGGKRRSGIRLLLPAELAPNGKGQPEYSLSTGQNLSITANILFLLLYFLFIHRI